MSIYDGSTRFCVHFCYILFIFVAWGGDFRRIIKRAIEAIVSSKWIDLDLLSNNVIQYSKSKADAAVRFDFTTRVLVTISKPQLQLAVTFSV
jgi:hypothetical protein